MKGLENINLPKQESPELSSKEKYSQLIREFLVNHPNTAFEERNSLTSVVEPEVDLYASRYFLIILAAIPLHLTPS